MKSKAEWKANYFINKLGIEGAKRQALEEIGNSDNPIDMEFYYEVLEVINKLKK